MATRTCILPHDQTYQLRSAREYRTDLWSGTFYIMKCPKIQVSPGFFRSLGKICDLHVSKRENCGGTVMKHSTDRSGKTFVEERKKKLSGEAVLVENLVIWHNGTRYSRGRKFSKYLTYVQYWSQINGMSWTMEIHGKNDATHRMTVFSFGFSLGAPRLELKHKGLSMGRIMIWVHALW